MADNLSGLNVATRVGEGNANVMSWGNLDRAANQLYQEQKQREARGYNDYLQGQAALQKEFSNVRSADIPDVVAAYNDLKKTKQAILFDDKIKNDAVALSKAQQQAQIKEAELRQLIKGSQELKDADKVINARKVSHPDDFDEVLVKEHINDHNLPLKDRIKTGRLDVTPYLYKGVDMAKLGQWAKESAGVARALPIGEEIVAEGGYKIEKKHILRSKNPVQYADNMYKRFQTNKGGQAAAALLNQMSDTKKQQIISSFNSIPDAEFKSKWGVDKKDLVNGVLPDDKAGQYVMLDAMQYAVNNMPQETESKFRPNEAFKNEQNIKEWNRRNNITNQQKTARAGIVAGGGYNPRVHVEEIYNNGSDDENKYPIKVGGKIVDVKGREISLPDPLQDKYFDKVGGMVQRPDKVIMDNDKKNIHLIYFNGKSANEQPRIDLEESRTIPITSSIIPNFEKSFGNPKKNLSFGTQSVPSPKVVKETKTFVFPTGKKKF